MLKDASGRAIAVEHTDAGTEEYQRFLAAASQGPCLEPSPGGRGWIGDEPIQRLIADVLAAIERKSKQRVWRDAPPQAERVLLVYCQVPVVCALDANEFPEVLAQRPHATLSPWAPSRLVVMHGSRLDTFAWSHGFWAIGCLSRYEVVP